MFDKLTIFYNKRTGSIKEMCSGIQSMDWFGDERQDYEMIYDFIVIDYDDYIMKNMEQFEIVDGEVKLKSEFIPRKYL